MEDNCKESIEKERKDSALDVIISKIRNTDDCDIRKNIQDNIEKNEKEDIHNFYLNNDLK